MGGIGKSLGDKSQEDYEVIGKIMSFMGFNFFFYVFFFFMGSNGI